MATVQPHPRPYELMTVLVPELGDEDLESQIERINGQIAAAGGEIRETLRESPWGRRRLAYTIRHNGQDYRDGYYVVSHFTLPPSRTTEIERELKLNVQVIRYLLVHDDPKVGERARDPELVVEHSDEAGAVQPTEVAATTAPVSSDPEVVEGVSPEMAAADTLPEPVMDPTPPVTDSAEATEAVAPASETAEAGEDTSLTDTPLVEEPAVESQATVPPVDASNADDDVTEEPTSSDETTQQTEETEREG